MEMRDGTGHDALLVGGTGVVAVASAAGATKTDNTAAILAFVGAVVVALIAAYTAHARQRRQLDAESERLARQLDAESNRLARQLDAENERLVRQLGHDRELSDVSDLRGVVESALDAIDEMALAQATVVSDDVSEDERALARERHAKSWQLVFASKNRLELRLGNDDEVLTAFNDLVAILQRSYDTANEQDEDRWREAMGESQPAYRKLVDQAKARIGSALPDG